MSSLLSKTHSRVLSISPKSMAYNGESAGSAGVHEHVDVLGRHVSPVEQEELPAVRWPFRHVYNDHGVSASHFNGFPPARVVHVNT